MGSTLPTTWDYLFRSTARILGLEMIAALASIEDFSPRHPNSCLWLYVDNNNALSALARGDSPTDIIAITVDRVWEILTRYNIHARFPRVRSKLNPSDLPSRFQIPPYPTLKKVRFSNINELFIRSRRETRLLPSQTTARRVRKHRCNTPR